ncbi:MAG: DUF4827 domain-containing protein [Candidatus Amulumruptor caecigallinarius]|nr:DUF4827 domain-containing protein [Candidatus Amulumruptor caecigallinarius]MCM1397197.1 DUF4827 domain-containing protein [Candidatus Amulumruptor caecigallinarius]MCM1453114.1 DUF4827 domain-containing protein [bacterium]
MKLHLTIALAAAALCMAVTTLSSCSKSESYAELLDDQNKDVNRFLADQRVTDELPADGIFETGTDAPYYMIDEEYGVYMQVLDMGDMADRAHSDQQVYFRFMRASLADYTTMDALVWSGNAETLALGSSSFRYENYTITSSSQWGIGIQEPLRYLGLGCTVNLVVKSRAGVTNEQSLVTPYLYNITYNKSPLYE